MTYRQFQAVITLAGQAIIAVWLVRDALRMESWDGSMAAAGTRLMWALLAVVVFQIVASIVVAIAVAIARSEQLKDERADERDRAIVARSMRNAYFVLSIGAAIALLMLASGVAPIAAVYVLFGALVLAAAADAGSQLVYYQVG